MKQVMQFARFGDSRRRFCLVLLGGHLALSCAASRAPEIRDLQNRIFDLPSGAAFGAGLAERPVKLLFTTFESDGRGHFVLSAPDPEKSGAPPRLSGHFDPSACAFEIEESSFEVEKFPGLQGGKLTMKSCEFESSSKSLVLYAPESGLVSRSVSARRLFNFVVILTDDQRWDTLWAMPVTRTLAERGVEFSNAYTTSPICCPFRASLLAGGIFTHNTNVLTNSWPNGGAERFDDRTSLATILADAGYRTGLFGKYLNGITAIAPRIPPGWTEFAANIPSSRTPEVSWSDFYALEGSRWPGGWNLKSSSEGPESGAFVHVTTYSPYYYQQRALSFLDRVGEEPFFLYIALRAPHVPATPAPEDADSFPGYDYHDRAYGEADLSDKPEWVRFEATRFEMWQRQRGDMPRKTLQSLQAVDRLVGAVRDKLERLGALDDTIIFFTSDSGYQWLEHKLSNKASQYEETLKIPLIVAVPGVEPRQDSHPIAVNLDIGATIFELIGSSSRTDGESLVPHWMGGAHGGREEIFFEEFPGYYTPEKKEKFKISFPSHYFAGLRTFREEGEWKYVEHYSGERELYDLRSDPYEEESLHGVEEYRELMDDFSRRLAKYKGIGITTYRLPPGTVGEPYSARLGAEGGTKPYSWGIFTEKLPGVRPLRPIGPKLDGLPEGLVFDGETGTIHGTPTAAGRFEFVVGVRDSSTSHRSGGSEAFYEHLALEVKAR